MCSISILIERFVIPDIEDKKKVEKYRDDIIELHGDY
jgi:hypothetical protein